MEIQFKNPKRFISLVLGLALTFSATVALPSQALTAEEAIDKIEAYAAADGIGDVPTVTDYSDAGVDDVDANNLAAVNAEIADLDATDVNTVGEIQGVVDYVNALIKISTYVSGTSGRPTAADYLDAGVVNANTLDLVEVNRAIGAAAQADSDTTDEIQGIVDLVNEALAIDIIADYTMTSDPLTVLIFELAGIEGVTSDNLQAMLVVFAAASSSSSNTQEEIQELVDDELAKIAAIELIARYDGDNDAPVLATYVAAGVVGVTAGNLSAMNAIFEDTSFTNSNTLEEIQAIVNLELARVAALARIAAYTGATNAPVLQTYIDAGVLRVDTNNVTAVNVLVAGASSANSDTLIEIQEIVDDQIAALAVLTNYTGAGTALTLAQYAAAGITGVTATNLTKVNIAIAAASVDASNTTLEVQTIVDGLNATAVAWTKRISDTQAKIYAKNIVGAGKVQFFLNGKEIAFVNATDAGDPKLRAANGAYYLVRTVNLATGKNVLEIKIKGTQVKRVVYSR